MNKILFNIFNFCLINLNYFLKLNIHYYVMNISLLCNTIYVNNI